LCYHQTQLDLAFKAAGGPQLGQTLLSSGAPEQQQQHHGAVRESVWLWETSRDVLSGGALPSSKHKNHVVRGTSPAASSVGWLSFHPSPPICPAPHVAGGPHSAGLCCLQGNSGSVEEKLWQPSTAADHGRVQLWDHPSRFSTSHPQG